MALNASSSCTKPALAMSEPAKLLSTSMPSNHAAGGVLPLPVKPKFESSALQRSKSRKPVKGARVSATAGDQSSVITEAVAQVGGASGEVLDAVADTLVDDAAIAGPADAMRLRKTSASKSNSRTTKRRALMMCLALGMVRPLTSSGDSTSSTVDLRRTASAMPDLQRKVSKLPSTLLSQVSLATTMKHTNLLGEQEDLQKLTSLQ